MRIFAIGLLFSVSLILAGATPEGEGKRSFDRQTGILTARLLIADWQKQTLNRVSAQGTDRILQMMKSDMKKYAIRSNALNDAEKQYMDALKQEYVSGAEKLLAPCRKHLTEREYRSLCSGGKDLLVSGRKNFPAAFEKARTHLAEDQRNRLFRESYPSAEEVESCSDQQLAVLLEERFRKGIGEPVMEENSSLVQKLLIVPVIGNARFQRKRQLEILAGITVPSGLWEPEEAGKFLLAAVEERRKEIPAGGKKLYPVFPGVKKAILLRGERIPFERVIAAFPKELSLNEYAEILKKEEVKHRKSEESFNAVQPLFVSQIIQQGITKAEVPEKFKKAVFSDAAVQKSAAEYYRKNIVPGMKMLRNRISEENLRKQWPELFGKWLPRMEETERFEASGTKTLPEIQGKPEELCSLEEAQLLVEKLLREKLVVETARLGKQRTAVVKEYESVVREMCDQQDKSRDSVLARWFNIGNVTFENIVACYRKHVEKSSAPPLFPSVEEEISVRSLAILQIVRTPPEKRKKTPRKTEYKLILSGQGDNLTLVFGTWKRTFSSSALPGEELRKELLRRMAAEEENTTVRILLSVSGTKIYYRTVADLRKILSDTLEGQVEDLPEPEKR